MFFKILLPILLASASYLVLFSPSLHSLVAYKLLDADSSINFAPLSSDDRYHPCVPLEVLYARNTLEPSPLGYRLGPRLKAELRRKERIGFVNGNIIGLDYHSVRNGTKEVVARIQRRAKECPKMMWNLVGYGTGAEVLHHALQQKNMTVLKERVQSIVVFGDPLTKIGWPAYYAKKGIVRGYCNPGDRSCGGTGIVGHWVGYAGEEAKGVHVRAANFIMSKFNVAKAAKDNGETLPENDRAPVMKGLPPMGDGKGFMMPWIVQWPPEIWELLYDDGVVVPTTMESTMTAGTKVMSNFLKGEGS